MSETKIQRIYQIFIFIGILLTSFLFAALPAWMERHEEIQFPCSRGTTCQTPEQVFNAVFLKVIVFPLIGYLFVYGIFGLVSLKKFSRWYWLPISFFGTILSMSLYSGTLEKMISSIAPFLFIGALLLPVTGIFAFIAFIVELSEPNSYARKLFQKFGA